MNFEWYESEKNAILKSSKPDSICDSGVRPSRLALWRIRNYMRLRCNKANWTHLPNCIWFAAFSAFLSGRDQSYIVQELRFMHLKQCAPATLRNIKLYHFGWYKLDRHRFDCISWSHIVTYLHWSSCRQCPLKFSVDIIVCATNNMAN